jgi:branched-chain amino acid aminotransferase
MYYNDSTILFLDGQFIKAKDAKVDLFGQTLHFGYGVFEGIRSYHTVNGTKIFKATDHYERLRKSASMMKIPLHYSVSELTQITYHILEKNKLSDAYIRPLVFCSPNMFLTAPKEVSLMITAWEWDRYLGENNLRVCISSYQRPNPKSVKIEAKVCGHYVNSILASTEARERGYDEGVLLDMNGNIAECPGSNIFVEKDNVLYTPARGNILPGITRETVIDICKHLDITVREKAISPEEFIEADSAFICGTAAEVLGIESVEGHQMRKPWKNSLGAIVQQAYRCLVLDKSYTHTIV